MFLNLQQVSRAPIPPYRYTCGAPTLRRKGLCLHVCAPAACLQISLPPYRHSAPPDLQNFVPPCRFTFNVPPYSILVCTMVRQRGFKGLDLHSILSRPWVRSTPPRLHAATPIVSLQSSITPACLHIAPPASCLQTRMPPCIHIGRLAASL